MLIWEPCDEKVICLKLTLIGAFFSSCEDTCSHQENLLKWFVYDIDLNERTLHIHIKVL